MFLLDTNVVSELRAGKPKPSAAVRAWAASRPGSAFHLSAITLLELELGVLRLTRRDPLQGTGLRHWLDGLKAAFAGRVLAFTAEMAVRCAALHVPDPKPERDAMIAATALVHGLTVVTRNVDDFAAMGVALHDPWQPAV